MRGLNSNQFIELKKKIVREALAGGNAAFVARQHELSPKTVNRWVKEYRDEVEEEMGKKDKEQTVSLNNEQDVKKQLDQALKLIGKLQVENEILKDLLKKRNNTRRSNRSCPEVDSA